MTTTGPAGKPPGRRSAGSRTGRGAGQDAGRPPSDRTPQTAAPDTAGGPPPDDVRELQQEIGQTREQLGDTVEQLVARADPKARTRGKAAELSGRVKDEAGQARAQAAARAGGVRDQLTRNATAAGQRGAHLGAAAKGQVLAAGGSAWDATPERARQAAAKGAGTAKQYRVSLAVAAGVLVASFAAVRWWRRR
jgi:uncharacterized protein YjbJ (UPF0337 family)